MTTLNAKKRETKTSGDINRLRLELKLKKSSKIQVVSISSIMAEAIKRISNSTSVSSLFK